MTTLTITNQRIFDFYNENPNINIETMNLLLLDFIKQLDTDMSKVLSNTLFGEILGTVKDIKQQVTSLNDTFSLKIHEYNREFLENIKLVIGVSSSENTEKITQLLNRTTESFIEKINITIPKTQEETSHKIQENLQAFKYSINDELKQYLSNSNSESNLTEFISTLDQKLNSMHQPIYTLISSNQESIYSRLDTIKDETHSNKTNNDKVIDQMSEFLNKYKSSSQFKGQCSENQLGSILNKMYPTAEINNTTSQRASGDFIIKRENLDSIMIENKNYQANVNIDEIKKFLRDANELKTHAIMMSQLSGIASKPNGFIEINDDKILIYLHNVDYSHEKIKMAIDIIDNLSSKLKEISHLEHDNGYSISKDTLEKINQEYQLFITQKDNLNRSIKDMTKQLTSQLDNISLPNLSIYLNTKFASIDNKQFICETCQSAFQSKRSLASHMKIHKKKSISMVDTEVQ
jgi:hypothetical protein